MTPDGQDWGAIYAKHRDSMYRVAARTLRDSGLVELASDAVHEAMESLMKSPPPGVRNWEALLVKVVKFRALDILKSAVVQHSGPSLSETYDIADESDDIARVDAELDRQTLARRAKDAMIVLDGRHTIVIQEFVMKGRLRNDVAAQLGVTPARISQMATKATQQLRDELARTEGK